MYFFLQSILSQENIDANVNLISATTIQRFLCKDGQQKMLCKIDPPKFQTLYFSIGWPRGLVDFIGDIYFLSNGCHPSWESYTLEN